jgi:hypothetical protein
LISLSAASEALRGGGELICVRYEDSEEGVRSDYFIISLCKYLLGRAAYSLSREPVVLEIASSQSFHQSSTRRGLKHLGSDLRTSAHWYTNAIKVDIRQHHRVQR